MLVLFLLLGWGHSSLSFFVASVLSFVSCWGLGVVGHWGSGGGPTGGRNLIIWSIKWSERTSSRVVQSVVREMAEGVTMVLEM